MKTPFALRTLSFLALVLGCQFSYASNFSGTSIPIPAGFVQGDTFQLVFVTSNTTTATSTNMSDYNSFVNIDANTALGSLVAGLGINWSCLCSTGAVNVLSNIVNTSPGTLNFEGIYDLAANEIADGTETSGSGLYSGSILNPIDLAESGTVISQFVWTGTDDDGTSDPTFPLGTLAPAQAIIGFSLNTPYDWTDAFHTNESQALPTYAISQLLELGPSDTLQVVTPEPATLGMVLFGLASFYHATRRKRSIAPPSRMGLQGPESR
jgi:hypothetical protein